VKKSIENFRALVVLSAVTLAIGVAEPYITSSPTQDQLQIMTGANYGALMDFSSLDYLWWSWIALYFAAHILAFMFSWLSRPVFIFTLVQIIVICSVSGMTIGTPLANAIWAVHYSVSTFAIGMLFFSAPVSAHIRRESRTDPGVRPESRTSDILPDDDY
jgi:hypothetical protein